MSAKEILLNWLAADDMKKVFQGLFFLAEKYRDEPLRHSTTLQSGRQKALETQRINGTLSHIEETLQSAKIRDALLQIIKGLPVDWTLEGMSNTPATFTATSKTIWKKYAAYSAAVVAVLAGIAVSGYSIRDFFGKKEKIENRTVPPPPAPSASTSGDNSPTPLS